MTDSLTTDILDDVAATLVEESERLQAIEEPILAMRIRQVAVELADKAEGMRGD